MSGSILADATWARVHAGSVEHVDFSGPERGVAAGFTDTTLLRSLDGGRTWIPISSPWQGGIHGVAAGPTAHFVGGSASVILEVVGDDVVSVGESGTPTGQAIVVTPGDHPWLDVRRTAEGFGFRLGVPSPGPVTLSIFDVAGRRVALVYSGVLNGEREMQWSGRDQNGHRVRPAVYLARLASPGGVAVERIVVLR